MRIFIDKTVDKFRYCVIVNTIHTTGIVKMDDFRYIPNIAVVTSARTFIKNLCETYGSQQGMAVWDHIRQGLGEQIASDIFLGMLTSTGEIRITYIGDRYIEAIKEVRVLTGWGLKEAKDFCDRIKSGTPGHINTDGIEAERVDRFVNFMKKIGCTVE